MPWFCSEKELLLLLAGVRPVISTLHSDTPLSQFSFKHVFSWELLAGVPGLQGGGGVREGAEADAVAYRTCYSDATRHHPKAKSCILSDPQKSISECAVGGKPWDTSCCSLALSPLIFGGAGGGNGSLFPAGEGAGCFLEAPPGPEHHGGWPVPGRGRRHCPPVSLEPGSSRQEHRKASPAPQGAQGEQGCSRSCINLPAAQQGSVHFTQGKMHFVVPCYIHPSQDKNMCDYFPACASIARSQTSLLVSISFLSLPIEVKKRQLRKYAKNEMMMSETFFHN